MAVLDDSADAEVGFLQAEPSGRPFVGQVFQSHDDAESFYRHFAQVHGFSIRKGDAEWRLENSEKFIKKREFLCHREGTTPTKDTAAERLRASTRCNCKAMLRISEQRNVKLPDFGKWKVLKFTDHHNHDMLDVAETAFLPAYRSLNDEDKSRILLLRNAGLATSKIIAVLREEASGQPAWIERDIYNEIARIGGERRELDAADVLQLLQEMKQEDDRVMYFHTVDDNHALQHIFWMLPWSKELYAKYHDVVVFDTTYQINRYKMPCGIFVGVNNHGQSIPLAGCLILDEKRETFAWVFRCFVDAGGIAPSAILTYQDQWMGAAIKDVFLQTLATRSVYGTLLRSFPAGLHPPCGIRWMHF